VNLRHVVLVPTLVLATTGLCQEPTTWHGLHFGDTRDHIRTELNQQGIETAQSPEGTLEATQDYDLMLPGLRYPLPILSSFHFTDAGTLSDVTLTINPQSMRKVWASALPGEDLDRFASDHLAGALAGRYGPPIYRATGCDATAKSEPERCIIFWNGPNESIVLERRSGRVFVRYQMLASDL